jgi:hypothetical protein
MISLSVCSGSHLRDKSLIPLPEEGIEKRSKYILKNRFLLLSKEEDVAGAASNAGDGYGRLSINSDDKHQRRQLTRLVVASQATTSIGWCRRRFQDCAAQ